MTFFSPENAAWLAALLPPLILLYFLKIRRKPVIVSSIMLWHKSLHDLQANAPFQRLRRNLLLILQIIVLLLIVGALARPIVRGSAFAGRHLILLLDRSASMGARDEDGKTRFEKAVEIAGAIADDPEKKAMMVISFADQASVETPFTSSPAELRRAVERLECAHTPTRLDDALRLAASAAKGKEDVKVVILSDGAVGAVPEVEERNFDVELIGLGKRSCNAAITGLSVRRPLEKSEPGIHLFVEISNFSQKEMDVPFEIRHEGVLANAARWSVPPGGAVGRTFRFSDIVEGLMTVHLDVEDDLPFDNEASVLVLPPRSPRVLLVSEGNVFLENALKTLPGVEVATVSGDDAVKTDRPFDVVVYDGPSGKPRFPVRGALYFGAVPPGWSVVAQDSLESPLFGDGDWNETHPVNRYADYSALYVRKAIKVALPEEATVLLESPDGPLVAAFEDRDRKDLGVFFRLTDSDWPFQVSFPVFLSNAVFWLYGGGDTGAEGRWSRTGDVIALPSGGGEIVDPEGGKHQVAGERELPGAFSGTEFAGMYEYRTQGGETLRYPVNLISPEESNLEPMWEIDLPGERVKARASGEIVFREYWPWFILSALGLLLLEWWVYHRRAI